MRFSAAALCVLALTGPALAETCHGHSMPPKAARREPTVKYTVYNSRPWQVQKACPDKGAALAEAWGCSYQNQDGSWTILMSDSIPLNQRSCMLQYEKSHLPPNYWGDVRIDGPAFMNWLAEAKQRSTKSQISP
jgi:hypothetical protein